MSDIKTHRDALITLFTKALDACIAEQNEQPGSVALNFVADIRFDLEGPTLRKGGDLNIKAGDGPGGGSVTIVGGVYRAGEPSKSTFTIRSRPTLDLTKPYDPSFPTKAIVVEP